LISMFTFRKNYFLLAVIFFVIEVLIALYVKDAYIRPYGGDVLVVILIYLFLKAFWKQSNFVIAMSVLAFSFCVEFAQYFRVIDVLGLSGNALAETVIGTTFHWLDLVCYCVGVVIVYFADQRWGTPSVE